MRDFFTFPDQVDDHAARTVATGVVLLAGTIIATGWYWLTPLLAYGFLARVAAGPKISPLALLATKVVVPRLPLEPKMVPGPPKRFAQSIGVAFSLTATILALGFGATAAAGALLAVLTLFAFLEAALGFCMGCQVFGLLMRAGIIPETVCQDCSNIWARYERTAT